MWLYPSTRRLKLGLLEQSFYSLNTHLALIGVMTRKGDSIKLQFKKFKIKKRDEA